MFGGRGFPGGFFGGMGGGMEQEEEESPKDVDTSELYNIIGVPP